MRKAIENPTQMPIFVAGMMIPPGETRLIEDDMLPPEHRQEAPIPEPEAPKDRIAEIADMKVDLILPILPDMSSEELARLQQLETEGKSRKTILEAIAAEVLKRAQLAADAAANGANLDAGQA